MVRQDDWYETGYAAATRQATPMLQRYQRSSLATSADVKHARSYPTIASRRANAGEDDS